MGIYYILYYNKIKKFKILKNIIYRIQYIAYVVPHGKYYYNLEDTINVPPDRK